MNRLLIAASIVGASLLATAPTAISSVFWAGTVVNAPVSDPLNIRAWPATSSRVLETRVNGERISLTGRCKNTVTNVSFMIDGPQSAARKYSRMRRANVWCQLVTPDGRVGWVRGRHVWPQ